MSDNPAGNRRSSIRLKEYDYSQAGIYFVTICCQDRICRFGKIENGEMILNDVGKIACNEWEKLPERYPNVLLDVFQIMPNHIHGIIVLNDETTVGATLAVAQNANKDVKNINTVAQNANTDVLNINTVAQKGNVDVQNYRAGASPAPTVRNIVGAYKSLVANQCLEIFKSKNKYMGKLWQRNYWEHIIRNDYAYQHIANYVINNPANWENDELFKS